MRRRGYCKVCSRRVWLRKDGTLGAHKVKVYNGWHGRLRGLIGIVQCAGSHRDPNDDELLVIHQTCGWCGLPRETLSHDCKKAKAK